MYRIFSFFIALLFTHNLLAQVSTEPAIPTAAKAVTITFDSSKESRLGYFTGDLYAHTGLITDKSSSDTDWKYVIESWGNNETQPKLTNKGNGIYELQIAPDILSFYKVNASDEVLKMAFVFRSSNGSEQTNNLYVDVFKEGLNLTITYPADNMVFPVGDTLAIAATATDTADLRLLFNETELAAEKGTSISADYILATEGQHWIIAEAVTDTTIRDSVKIVVKDFNEPKPTSYKKGINYTSDTSAALVLWAPLKTNVYVVGDFNNWQVSDDYLMKKDGDYFWLDIENLEKGQEYAYQYFIDGTIKIADPYTEKILDEGNDPWIPGSVYPNLKVYPAGKTQGIVSVLQTGQEEYRWEVTDFELPDVEKMIIYELLIRDFTEEHSYASVIEKLDYLEELNVNVLELMPVNEFEGNSSWGYNPAFYFAPDKYYGPKNELKRLIDECHKRGIAVVIDMVLNHSYGQSPFVQMYMDNWTITEENPWYNISSPNPVFSWGYDFNHESEATKELVDSVNSFWINEYKVDGFRFDFTKGFTNTPGDGSGYDQPRINILKRMSDEIWKRKSDALVILEHFASNTEETILADYGMMIWGNKNHDYGETAMGYGASLYNAVAENRGWKEPHLVTYMESHDEERMIYKCENFGGSNGSYNTRDLGTALDRIKLNSVFFIPLPGPKMIWQFGELGYDYSINHCPDGSVSEDCRTSEKPLVWDYLEDTDRKQLFNHMAGLNELKQSHEEFSPTETAYSLANQTKWYKLSKGDKHIVGLGNFDLVQQDIAITFPSAGKYYEYFSGDSIDISSSSQTFTFEAGEYRLYSTTKFNNPDIPTNAEAIERNKGKVLLYPNPANSMVNFRSDELIGKIEIYSVSGALMLQEMPLNYNADINVSGLKPGIYLSKIYHGDTVTSRKLMVK